MDLIPASKGLLKSLSEGVRNLLVLDEKLTSLGKEGDRTRAEVKTLQEIVYKLLGRIEEMDRRLADRFSDLDKRLNEIDKRVEVQVKLTVKDELDRKAKRG